MKHLPLPKLYRVLQKLLFLFFSAGVLAQDIPPPTSPLLPKSFNDKKATENPFSTNVLDSLSVKSLDDDISIANYFIISQARDTVHVDTTLTIAKYYKFNSQRRDNFAHLTLNNSGQALNPLSSEAWYNETAPARRRY